MLRIVRTKTAPVLQRRKMMHWEALIDITGEGRKKWTPVTSNGTVVDYRDVAINGYLSTFGNIDRDGEVVRPGAFAESLQRFMANPVLLINHENDVRSLAGVFTKAVEDENGLYVEAMLSNAPGNTDTRWKVVEGILRSLSMGGIFHYAEDGRTIVRVDLWEGSLVAVPANPRATISVRSLTTEEEGKVMAFKMTGTG